AGLFSTADDLARFARALLDHDSSLLSAAGVEKMTTPQQPANASVLRGLGWDIDSPFSTNRGELLPVGSFGHTGFTGTSLWIDPATQTYIILLSNAIHPSGTNSEMVSLRTRVANAVAAGLNLYVNREGEQRWAAITGYNETLAGARRLPDRNGTVRTGIDVLESRGFALLRHGRNSVRAGLLTNQTGVDSQGRRTIDVLAHAPGVSLVAIFSPEHGATGTLDTTEIGNTRDAATGIPIYSVYGATDTQRRPPMEVLKQLDVVVIDLQDAGVPFFTYEVTMGYFLEAAAQAGIEVFVLDRPNPITGSFVQGPAVTHEPGSFKGYFPLPVRHGMTMGELAKLFNSERAIHALLTVVAMEGWQRGDWYDATGLAWINPSPNLRSLNAATLYAGVALVEGTNVSVGRGTDTPFEVVGAPWIDARQLAEHLNRRQITGLRFMPVRFTPVSGPYANQLCGGVNLLVTRRNGLDSPEIGVELAAALHRLYPNDFKIERMIDILGNQAAFDAIVAGEDPRRIAEDWREPLAVFERLREKYLLY
ncbi:MAG: exo-beta-N-acetylmuramidase NamZ domain-containing protein, partial [Terriglobales bacterium]